MPFVLIVGFLIAGVCGYMAGLIGASNSPISGVGILSIVICASVIAIAVTPTADTRPALVAFALFVTAIVFACATISNDNLQDLKTGQLVGASPMRQQIALIVGVAAGAAVIPFVLNLLAKAYGFAGAANVGVVAPNPLPAPQATLISALAQGVIGGNLEWKMIGIGALVGVGLILLDTVLGAMKKLRIPPLAVGIGIYLPMSATFAVVVGAVLAHWYDKRARTMSESRARRATGDARRVGADRRREPVGRAQRRADRRAREGRADRARARGLRAGAVARIARLRRRDRVALRLDAASVTRSTTLGMGFRIVVLRTRRSSTIVRTVLCGLLIGARVGAQDRAMPPESERQLARAIYKEMVEIKTGYTTGATTPLAEAVARRLRAAGFPAADIFVGGASPTKANLVVRYRGTGRQRPLLLLAHTDVVEAKREDWSIDPFTFVEKDGYFHGRGTGDDKAQAAIWIANLIRYKREGFRPDRDLIVALTADEEGGGPYNGVVWLLKNRRELIDAELCLNEGGWGKRTPASGSRTMCS